MFIDGILASSNRVETLETMELKCLLGGSRKCIGIFFLSYTCAAPAIVCLKVNQVIFEWKIVYIYIKMYIHIYDSCCKTRISKNIIILLTLLY